MIKLVIDASVSVKWLIPEELHEQAQAVQERGDELIAPGHWRTELVNAVWKKHASKRDIGREACETAMKIGLALPMNIVPVEELLESAVQLALQHSRTVYDSLYIALALREKCQFVTADLKLYNAMKDALPETMLWLGDC
ncbi:MAG: type II toxin-antitoxin system VapC family toxin [Dehalococcoidia bacterium]